MGHLSRSDSSAIIKSDAALAATPEQTEEAHQLCHNDPRTNGYESVHTSFYIRGAHGPCTNDQSSHKLFCARAVAHHNNGL